MLMYLLGQTCGIIGTVITIIQPQFCSKVQILLCGILVNSMNALNFVLIGERGSSVFLCLIAIVQSTVSVLHERKSAAVSYFVSVVFFFLYIGFGFFGMVSAENFVWEISRANLLELLPIIGALMLMFSVFARGEQRTRLFLLLNGASWMVYTAVIGAAVFFSCLASVISSIIALWKHRAIRA